MSSTIASMGALPMVAPPGQQDKGQTDQAAADKKAVDQALQGKDDAKLKKALSDFEAIFLRQMMSTMRQTVPDGGLLGKGKGQGEKMFRELLDGEYAKNASQKPGGFGLKEMVYQQLMRQRLTHPVNSFNGMGHSADSSVSRSGGATSTSSPAVGGVVRKTGNGSSQQES